MASFDTVNYGLRPSKSIQRQLVFDGIRLLFKWLDVQGALYVGFGSIWFVDFVMAHKILSIDDMISIEKDEVGYLRAQYNSPFATVEVRRGISSKVLTSLCQDEELASRPWVLWLDYDGYFDECVNDDLRLIIEKAPPNSVVLTTFNAHEKSYGTARERPERLKDLFGEVVPEDLTREQCKGDGMQRTLASLATKFMKAVALDARRPGGFVPAFRIVYRDSAPMVTVGGVLPEAPKQGNIWQRISDSDWQCQPTEVIAAPHLTIREVMALQSTLPNPGGLTRKRVKELGFDLEEDQIQVYERYYREYPSFAEVVKW
ncbi:O-methyltransferase [Candidatus Foliamicus sp.]